MPDLTSFRDSSHFYVRTTFMSLRTSSNLRIAVDGLCISSNNYKGECCFIKPSYSFLDLPIIRIKIKTDFPSQAKQCKYPHNHPNLLKKLIQNSSNQLFCSPQEVRELWIPYLYKNGHGAQKLSWNILILIILSFPLQTDLNSKRAVSSKDGQRWAKAHDLRSVNLHWLFLNSS